MAEKDLFAEIVRGWSSNCSLCGQPCTDGEVKEVALGHAMHQACYDKWLMSQDDGAQLEKKRQGLAKTDALRRQMEEWVASARWVRKTPSNFKRKD